MERFLPHLIPGLIYGIGALGIALTYRYLKFPDFTAIGSIMVGGVLCVSVSNLTNAWIGLFVGTLGGGSLGILTGTMIVRLKIEPVLAGIITFTASTSIGYLFAPDGTIGLGAVSPISPTFHVTDAGAVLMIALFLCFSLATLIRTKFGSLLLAMTAERPFLRSRHRDRGKVTVITLLVANSIVGFSGALYGLKDSAAFVLTHADFLTYSLGAIFGGNAVTKWVSYKLQEGHIENVPDQETLLQRRKFLRSLAQAFSVDRDDATRMWILFPVYVIGCVVLKEISGLVFGNALASINPILSVPPNIQYLVVAILIAALVWWAGSEEE